MPNRHTAVGLHHDEAHGLGEVSAQAAGILDFAAGDDEAHERQTRRPTRRLSPGGRGRSDVPSIVTPGPTVKGAQRKTSSKPPGGMARGACRYGRLRSGAPPT